MEMEKEGLYSILNTTLKEKYSGEVYVSYNDDRGITLLGDGIDGVPSVDKMITLKKEEVQKLYDLIQRGNSIEEDSDEWHKSLHW